MSARSGHSSRRSSRQSATAPLRGQRPVEEAWVAAEALLGVNRYMRAPGTQLLSGAMWLLALLARHPLRLARIEARLALRQSRVLLGLSSAAPRPEDNRFSDPVWRENPYYRRVLQGYLVWCEAMEALTGLIEQEGPQKDRLRFLISQFTAAAAPTNFPAGNPEFPARVFATRGLSLLTSLRNVASDLRDNNGLPRQVDEQAFRVGGNLATTPGAVVFRDAVCELIQYTPVTADVNATPVLIIPPQINKYYIIDLAPGRSLVEHALARGQQVFCLSWRNPTAAQRDWGLETYVASARTALEAMLEITAQPAGHVMAACAGGLTAAVLAGYLQAEGVGEQIASLTLMVTVLDMRAHALLGLFASESSLRASVDLSRRRGVLDGKAMASAFAWLRPDDLVWRFHVNNYVLGKRPPAFDILYWNNDNTRLPAQFHADMLGIYRANPLVKPGSMKLLGRRIDLSAVRCPVFILAGESDHISPWQACYRSAGLFGGKTRFVLSSSGHIQSIVNPPANRRSRYREHADCTLPAERWHQQAQIHDGSWWDEWLNWLAGQRGQTITAPESLGSESFPPLAPAPGRYVMQK